MAPSHSVHRLTSSNRRRTAAPSRRLDTQGGKEPRCSRADSTGSCPLNLPGQAPSPLSRGDTVSPVRLPRSNGTYRGRHTAAWFASCEASARLSQGILQRPPPARRRRRPLPQPPVFPRRSGAQDLPPGQGDPAGAPRRPPARLGSRRACGARCGAEPASAPGLVALRLCPPLRAASPAAPLPGSQPAPRAAPRTRFPSSRRGAAAPP